MTENPNKASTVIFNRKLFLLKNNCEYQFFPVFYIKAGLPTSLKYYEN